MRIEFPSAFVHKRPQILMLRSIPLLSWSKEILFFHFVHHFLNHRCEMFIERFLLLAIGNKPLNLLPGSNRRTHFLWSKVFFFFFFDWVKWKIIFSFVLFSSREKKRKDNYPYLWQWIIEIFIITQPYELCAKRETKIGMVLSRKLTYFLLVL